MSLDVRDSGRPNPANLQPPALFAAFMTESGGLDERAFAAAEQVHAAAVARAAVAIADGDDLVRALRQEALEFPIAGGRCGASLVASDKRLAPEKAVLASAAALAGDGPEALFAVAHCGAQISGADGDCFARSLILAAELHAQRGVACVAAASLFAAMMNCTADQLVSAVALAAQSPVAQPSEKAQSPLQQALACEAGVVAVRRALRGVAAAAGMGDSQCGGLPVDDLLPTPRTHEALAICDLAQRGTELPPELDRAVADRGAFVAGMSGLAGKSPEEIQQLYAFELRR